MAETPMLTCQELVELVTDYLEGVMPAPERVRFDDHLRLCDPCVEYVAQMRLTVALAGRIDPDGVEPAARDRLLAHFRGWRAGNANPRDGLDG